MEKANLGEQNEDHAQRERAREIQTKPNTREGRERKREGKRSKREGEGEEGRRNNDEENGSGEGKGRGDKRWERGGRFVVPRCAWRAGVQADIQSKINVRIATTS